jgi:hypothetical protein
MIDELHQALWDISAEANREWIMGHESLVYGAYDRLTRIIKRAEEAQELVREDFEEQVWEDVEDWVWGIKEGHTTVDDMLAHCAARPHIALKAL